MIGLGEKIRDLRKIIGWSQTRLAEFLCTTQDTISLWELEKSYPDIHNLIKIAQKFEVTTDYLLGLED